MLETLRCAVDIWNGVGGDLKVRLKEKRIKEIK
jgi:hypothetical protein